MVRPLVTASGSCSRPLANDAMPGRPTLRAAAIHYGRCWPARLGQPHHQIAARSQNSGTKPGTTDPADCPWHAPAETGRRSQGKQNGGLGSVPEFQVVQLRAVEPAVPPGAEVHRQVDVPAEGLEADIVEPPNGVHVAGRHHPRAHVSRGLPAARRRPGLVPGTIRTMTEEHPHRPAGFRARRGAALTAANWRARSRSRGPLLPGRVRRSARRPVSSPGPRFPGCPSSA